MVIGGQWWWRRSLGVLREGLGEEKEEEDGSFTLLDVFVACNTRPGEPNLPRRADPQLKFFASVKKSYIILNMLYYKSQQS